MSKRQLNLPKTITTTGKNKWFNRYAMRANYESGIVIPHLGHSNVLAQQLVSFHLNDHRTILLCH